MEIIKKQYFLEISDIIFSENWYLPNTDFKTLPEAVSRQTCSVKKMFLEISQNWRKNTCYRVSFFIKLQAQAATLLKKRLCHRCFSVNFVKFLSKSFLKNTFGRLLLHFGSIDKFSLKFCLMPEKYTYCGFNWKVSKISFVRGAKRNQLY